MIEFHELAGVVIQADKILALARATGAAGQCQWKNQLPQAQRLEHGLVKNAIKRCGDGAILGHEPPGGVKDPQVMREPDLELGMACLDALVGHPVRS